MCTLNLLYYLSSRHVTLDNCLKSDFALEDENLQNPVLKGFLRVALCYAITVLFMQFRGLSKVLHNLCFRCH